MNTQIRDSSRRLLRPNEMKALSIRQPWAWLIVNGFKDIENRPRKTNFRGTFLIHASKHFTSADYEACYLFLASSNLNIQLPEFDYLHRFTGGIVGQANLVACITESPSSWFTGEYGYCLALASPLTFQPCKGMLGFFTPKLKEGK